MKRRYVYTDRSFGKKVRATVGSVLFVFEADSILAADKAFKAATVIDPMQDASVWCSIEDVQ